MSGPAEQTPSAGTAEPDLAGTGERIEALLEASSAHGAMNRERAEELVRLVADLYGAGMERMLDVLHDSGALDRAALDALSGDPLVSSLLLVHGLHPYDLTTRVQRALDDVRPYLGSHGGDVELVEVTDGGVVRLRMLGSCDGCASSSVTLTLAVEGAVQQAAPEVSSIEVVGAEQPRPASGVISVDSLRTRLDPPAPGGEWVDVPELADLSAGEFRTLTVGGLRVAAARVAAQRYAYLDECGRCAASLAGAALERRLGGAAGDAIVRCAACGAHFDLSGAGQDVDGRLQPLPLLMRGEVVCVSVPSAVGGR